MARIAVGGFQHETNTFAPQKATFADFEAPDAWPGLTRGAALLDAICGINLPAAGFVDQARARRHEVLPLVWCSATPSAHVTRDAYERIVTMLLDELQAASNVDAVYLDLHGAMVAEHIDDADGELLRRVRQRVGARVPVVASLDFHANVSEDIVRYSDVLITYKENPHLDTKQRGMQAAKIMAGMVSGKIKPVQAIAKPPMIVNLVYQDTFHEPFKHITDESRRLERENPKILAASVPGGYQWADVPAMGPSAIVVTDNDPELAEREAKRLSEMLWAIRDKLVFKSPDPAKAVREAMAADKFPVVLMDTGDNIGGGSAGDGTFILAELVKQKAQGWVMVIADAAANQAAFAAGVGGAFDQMVGGKTDKIHGEPVRIKGRVKALTDGQYVETEIRHGGGRYGGTGLTAVIEVEGSTRDLPNLLLLTNRPTSPNSLQQLISNGVYPARQRILVAKGTTAPRAAYEPVAAKIVEVNSGGATDVNPKRFTYKHARPGLFGLEK